MSEPRKSKPAYGEIGHETYIVEISYPHSWRQGHTSHFSSMKELEENVVHYKNMSGPRGSADYIQIRAGISTLIH